MGDEAPSEDLLERFHQLQHDYEAECERSDRLEKEYEDLEERYKNEKERIATMQASVAQSLQ